VFEIFTVSHPRLSEAQFDELKIRLAAQLPGDNNYQITGGWIDGNDIGMEVDPEAEVPQGIGTIVVSGNQEILEQDLVPLRAIADQEGADFLHHPHGAFQGIVVRVNGERIWIEGLAAELFGGNVFDQALNGHPASAQFLARVLPFAGESVLPIVRRAMSDPSVRDEVRQKVEEESGVSFDDDKLYYGKGESGLGNVYAAAEIGIEA